MSLPLLPQQDLDGFAVSLTKTESTFRTAVTWKAAEDAKNGLVGDPAMPSHAEEGLCGR